MSDVLQFGNYLVFNGITSTDYGVWISGTGTFDAPVRDVQYVQVPGKSGDLILDNGRYNNIEITYPAFISKGFRERFNDFRAAMLSTVGYATLSDTYHPDEFRIAALSQDFRAITGPNNASGRFDIVFNCQPQRYLVSGITPVTVSGDFTAEREIVNETAYTAKPLIRITPTSGTYATMQLYNSTTGRQTNIAITTNYPYSQMNIDCETLNAWYDVANANTYLQLLSGDFPTLDPGTTTITCSGVDSYTIIPRWFTL